MKKILFLQIKSNSVGGVWFVNKTLGHEFIKRGYTVELLSIRRCPGKDLVNEKLIKTTCVNTKDSWEFEHFSNCFKYLKKGRVIKFLNSCLRRIINEIKLKNDYIKAKKYILKFKPDYIISTHYQLLDVIPKKYLSRTIHEQHTSFAITKTNKKNIKTFNKYKNKINFLWLSESTCNLAIKSGYKNSNFIYNPVRISTKKTADIINNKKIVLVTRIDKLKGTDVAVRIVDKLFNDKKLKDWSFEIYGEGELRNDLEKQITNKKQIKFMGHTSNVLDVYLSSSININTSLFEGFPMSILEANECGVPTITFNYGESVYDLIENNKTGIIIEDRNEDEYLNKLKALILDKNLLINMSKECKKFNKNFEISNVINEWEKYFKSIDR